ncbi:MAG: SWIM zinc finger family protein [Synergistaceae bacterium]|jgi:uncharacterized Zn finger protein|nr:SWIM zinc finger family protein [Synergistaceae bacterium]PKL03852.1 MAG: hypothetical protein CVV54_09145 [Synergistetes bacterium HGW-Synergistetes-1]MBP9559581.1 SWIM zinc finger family protein [Synergistaceae bacterium]MBP9974936.1 SWIM zinc finger family protein [Synergistaceae bacterium]MDD2350149.1 SWIM zinc finger family protein [Synergistaceae bacterium]
MYRRRTSWTYTKPLSTRGGIKSRVNRGRFHGSNWWSRRWIEILEGSIDSARLARGRSYARRGQVVDIDIEPGLVTASVQGTRKKPYQIRLGFEILSEEAKALLLFRFRERSSFAATLLAGEMPEEMEKVFKEAGTGLFPSKSALRRYKCSCPDDAVPCKHIIAVLLLLAEVFDDDPFLLLKLRGVNREGLINLLTLETSGDNEELNYEEDETWEDGDGSVISGGSDNAAENITDTYKNGEECPSYSKWYGEEVPEFKYNIEENERQIAALEIINDFPFWRGELPFRQSLSQYYERAANSAEEILTGEKKKTVGRPRKLI